MGSIHSPVEHGENPKEATMKTPHAILIGLSLIAAAIFFNDSAVKPAHAFGGPDGFGCSGGTCWVFEGDTATSFWPAAGGIRKNMVYNWRKGKRIK